MADPVISDEQVEEALRAFHKGPPGVVRKVELIDSYPGEYRGDPQAYNRLPCTRNDEVAAIRAVLEAYERTLDPNRCLQSQRPGGGHCDHSWSHDTCCWCGRTWGESGCRVTVAEDPVREAARKVVEVCGSENYPGTANSSAERFKPLLAALRKALAQPAPSSLTEDERKAALGAIEYVWDTVVMGAGQQVADSAREKLSR